MHYCQTEGQMYTDTEWVIEPMVMVEKLLFISEPVNCYLIGRDGQSVDKETLRKNFQQILNIGKKLIRNYEDEQKYVGDGYIDGQNDDLFMEIMESGTFRTWQHK